VNGKVKWYDQARKFGFIETQQGDVFVHASGILFGLQLAEGDEVTFDITRDEKSGRNKATDVRAA
jgi:cold shock CspA family protein